MDDMAAGFAAFFLFAAFALLCMFVAASVAAYGLLTVFGKRLLGGGTADGFVNAIVNALVALACGVLLSFVALVTFPFGLLVAYPLTGVFVLGVLVVALSRLYVPARRSTGEWDTTARPPRPRLSAIGVSMSCVAALCVLAAPPFHLYQVPRAEEARNEELQEDVLMELPSESFYDIDRTELAPGNGVEIHTVDPGYASGLSTTYSVVVADESAPEEAGLQYIRVLQYGDGFDRRMEECVDNERVGDPWRSDGNSVYCNPLLVTPEGREVRIYGYVNDDTEPTVTEHHSFLVRLEDNSYAILVVDSDLSENGLVGKGRDQFDLVSAIDALEAVPKGEFRGRTSGHYEDAD